MEHQGTTTNAQKALTPEQLNDLDTLVVVSKVKSFIRKNGEMNTSSDAIEAISKLVAGQTLLAIENAKKAGRKTVMARDFSAE